MATEQGSFLAKSEIMAKACLTATGSANDNLQPHHTQNDINSGKYIKLKAQTIKYSA